MPAVRPPARFLLRGSLLLVGLLVLWHVALVNPLLFLLQHAAVFPLRWISGGAYAEPIRAAPGGNWTVQVPVPAFRREALQRQFGQAANGAPAKLRSIRLSVPKSSATIFTLGLPIFWAITLAAPLSRRTWRVLLAGTALLEAVAVLCFLLFILSVVNENLRLFDRGAGWLLDYAEYLNTYVIPYLAPVAAAVALNRDLRAQIFAWQPDGPAAKPMAPAPANRRWPRASR